MKCNGERLRQARILAGMTQEKLSIMSAVTVRTVQRAEASAALDIDTFAQLASAVKVHVSDLILIEDKSQNAEIPNENAVRLKRCVKGSELVGLLTDSFTVSIKCEVEPPVEYVAEIADFLDMLESLAPNPWDPKEGLTIGERLRVSGQITAHLERVSAAGLALFAGAYPSLRQLPRYDMDEGHYYVRTNQTKERVNIGVVIVDFSYGDTREVSVSDKHTPVPWDDDPPF